VLAPDTTNVAAGSCIVHRSLAPLVGDFSSATWLKRVARRRVVAVIGHSHQFQLFAAYCDMLRAALGDANVVGPEKNDTAIYLWGRDPPAAAAAVPLPLRLLAIFVRSNFLSFPTLAALEGAAPTDIVVGRGIWAMLNVGIAPEDLRAQLQLSLAEVRRRFPAARLTLHAQWAVHRRVVHRYKKDIPCPTLAAQLVYRDAQYAAVRNFNAAVLPAAAFRDSSDALDQRDAVAVRNFLRPVAVLDVFPMTATPEAAALSDWPKHGHHYATAVIVNVVVRLLRGNNSVEAAGPAPPVAVGAAPVNASHLMEQSGLQWHGNRTLASGDAAVLALYDRLQRTAAFHRYRSGAAQLDRSANLCNGCRMVDDPTYVAMHASAAWRSWAVASFCFAAWYRAAVSCYDPVGFVAAAVPPNFTDAYGGPNMSPSAGRCITRALRERDYN
jgi:hypothetical protein